ncbi:MAG: hypothetical protein OHK0046_35300 [Anaerolineae bacterium]
MRYIRAFFTALRITIRGEQPSGFVQLVRWIEATPEMVKAVYTAAEAQGLNKAHRQALVTVVDGRDTGLQTALAAVEYHARQEYPYLLKNLTEHAITAIYATNLNDQYAVQRFAQLPELVGTPAGQALAALEKHLTSLPPSTEVMKNT